MGKIKLIKLVQFLNITDILSTLDKLKFDIFNVCNEEASLNIPRIDVTLLVSKFDTSISVSDLQLANNHVIFVTFKVLKLLIFKLFKLVHP